MAPRKVFDTMLQVPIRSDLKPILRESADRRGVCVNEHVRQILADALRAQGFAPPSLARRLADRRIEEVAALPEAAACRPLAETLARETTLGIDRIRCLLAGRVQG